MNFVLPMFPRTPHVPRQNLVISPGDDDIVANDLSPLSHDNVVVEEKLDGANCGIALGDDGHPIVRNRTNVLQKGYVKKNTPSKVQFRSVWNWFYDNKGKFEKLNNAFGGPVGVYGEWMLALHGIVYDKLPAFFVPYDVYDPTTNQFINPIVRREVLSEAGFFNVPLLRRGPVTLESLIKLTQQQSQFGPDLVEGVYIKVWDNKGVTNRFKMIRDGYAQGCKWSDEKITKQKLV